METVLITNVMLEKSQDDVTAFAIVRNIKTWTELLAQITKHKMSKQA